MSEGYTAEYVRSREPQAIADEMANIGSARIRLNNLLVEERKQLDAYGLALMMIKEGVADPAQVAREALAKFNR